MPSSNATPSVNGWFFQISAGMFLFLRNIKTSKTLKIEGPSEDIEIETEDGLIYAQAKCLNDIKARDSVPAHYKKALKSLKSNQGKAAKLIYISNIEDPFSEGEDKLYCLESEFEFDQLKAKTQDRITAVLGEDFDYGKLSIVIKHFYGAKENKKKILLEEIGKFLIETIKDDAFKYSVYDSLVTEGLLNASDRVYRTTKTKFVFQMILPYLEDIQYREDQLSDNEDDYDEAVRIFRAFLKSFEADYEIISSVLADYKAEKGESKLTCQDYAIAHSVRFIHVVPDNYAEPIRKELAKILVYRILKRHYCLESVKKAANL